jgi:hypothetical protein
MLRISPTGIPLYDDWSIVFNMQQVLAQNALRCSRA